MVVGGSRWRRVDFHLHTPGVDSFAGLDGMNVDSPADQLRLAEAYAQRMHEVGIELAAITDYNGIRQSWFELIKEAAAVRGITVLPGAELSLAVGRHGIHILAVFPADTDPQEINEVLRSLQRQPGTPLWNGRTHAELDLRDPAGEALRFLRDRFGCLLFAAHAEERKGIIQAMGARHAAQLIAEIDLDGMDHFPDAGPKLRSTGIQFRWDHLAMVEFSDPRRLADIGGKTLPDGTPRGTWLKLSATDLDAIRLALHDPQTRVRTITPALPSNGRIASMTVDGRGFLADLNIAFDPHLNTLIGGRGTGKSAVLETIRYALGADPYCDPERRDRLVAHALGSGGSVRLCVERHTETGTAKRYEIVRSLGRLPEVVDLDTGQLVAIDPLDTFGPNRAPVILLQREIDTISTDATYLRDLLDRLIGDDVHHAEQRVADIRRQLSLNSSELHKHRLDQGRRADIEQRSALLTHELGVYEDNGVLEKLATHRKLAAIDRDLDAAVNLTTDDSVARLTTPLTERRRDLDELRVQLGTHEDEVTREAGGIVDALTAEVHTLLTQTGAIIRAANEKITALRQRHATAVHALTESLDEVKKTLHADKFDPDAMLRYTAELDRLNAELAGLDRKKPAIDQLNRVRRGILDELAKARAVESQVRQDAAELINARVSQRLEVVVQPLGDRDQFATDLKHLLQGSAANATAINAVASAAGLDGAAIAVIVDGGPQELTARLGLTSSQAMKIHTWLTDPEADRLAVLEALAPRDRVALRLRTGTDSRDLGELSAGQRATAILLLIFVVDGRAMLLDQPEDDLDNRFIFEDVVTMIRQQKALTPDGHDRQIIAATHNPNIPMLGDAELVAVLDADSTTMTVASHGSIDALEIRTHIRQVLEGGEEAFLRRYQKYGGIRLSLPNPRRPAEQPTS